MLREQQTRIKSKWYFIFITLRFKILKTLLNAISYLISYNSETNRYDDQLEFCTATPNKIRKQKEIYFIIYIKQIKE